MVGEAALQLARLLPLQLFAFVASLGQKQKADAESQGQSHTKSLHRSSPRGTRANWRYLERCGVWGGICLKKQQLAFGTWPFPIGARNEQLRGRRLGFS